MSANKKARDKAYFEIATMGKVSHPTHRQVTSANRQKKDRKRAEQRELNLARFKRD